MIYKDMYNNTVLTDKFLKQMQKTTCHLILKETTSFKKIKIAVTKENKDKI